MDLRAAVIFLYLVSPATGLGEFFMGRHERGFILIPEKDERATENTTTTHWFTQKLDHFNPLETRTFQQRYMVKSTHYNRGGPIFVMLGGEGSISPKYIDEGRDITFNAIKYGAMLWLLEHRFYGKTQPTPDVSTENLQYLSSEQALEDAAYFIQTMKAQTGLSGNKVIIFGGSYSGALANWFRMKYPQIANGAVGSSAPVWVELDFYRDRKSSIVLRGVSEYLEVVKNSLDMISPGCSSLVKQAFSSINSLIQQGNTNQLNATFNLCTPVNLSDPYSAMSLYQNLIYKFQGNVQYNGQAGYAIAPLCNAMRNVSLGSPIERMASLYNPKQYCFPYAYQIDIDLISQTSWDARDVRFGTRQWIYQTCTEFGYFQTPDSTNQPFGYHFSLDYIMDVYCRRTFGIVPSTIKSSIAQSNQLYGSTGLKANWLVMANGNIDPWHSLGILHDINPSSIAIFMNGTSHCQDMGYHTSNDSPQLIAGRKRISEQIGVILRQHNNYN